MLIVRFSSSKTPHSLVVPCSTPRRFSSLRVATLRFAASFLRSVVSRRVTVAVSLYNRMVGELYMLASFDGSKVVLLSPD